MKLKYLLWIPFAFLAIATGLYPLIYYFIDMHGKGLWASKTNELIANTAWHTAFYTHITFGGIALLTGWTQFSKRLRYRYLNAHRQIGKVYVAAVMLSSLAGLYIALFAYGGIASVLGFGALAALWFLTIIKAYTSILKKDIKQHENWMKRNYALAFAAVTLRLYLPCFQAVLHMDFIAAYRIISWLCWVPNLIIAEIIVYKTTQIPAYAVHQPMNK
ncbi:MAG: hypothetical protein JWP78_218 [Mucilaginibacter sp.]|nr:hypothetical protein [Mucilaginibacter sp.]